MDGARVSLVVTGSVATDHLMVFPGRFREQLIEGELDTISLSFLVDGMEIYRGGVGANISFGLGRLGLRPFLVAAVGTDFGEYRDWLEHHNVDTSHVHVSEHQHTARFVCTTDADQNQIASFYPGAMTEARDIDLARVLRQLGTVGSVVVCPDDPVAMVQHARVCRENGIVFAADPSLHLASMDGPEIRELVEGAAYLFTNEYERELLEQKTGWTRQQVLARVGRWVTTLGPKGATIEARDSLSLSVPAVEARQAVDPTGAGDAFRSGFLAGTIWQLGPELAAQLGCALATLALETKGTQEYALVPAELLVRLADAYGRGAASDIETHLSRMLVEA